MDVIAVVKSLMQKGWRQDDLAEKLDVTQATISRWLAGADPRGSRRDALRALAEDEGLAVVGDRGTASKDEGATIIPIMGSVGAGAEILPEFEQVPPEGLGQAELPFPIPDDMVGFEVRGDSMLPAYKDGHVILCWKEQRRPTKTYLGEEVAVRTTDGRRFLKVIKKGSSIGTFDLESWNASPIERVKIEWVGEIYAILPKNQILKMAWTAPKKQRVTR